jgi:hypothetical protein
MQTANSVQSFAIIAYALLASSLVRKGRADPQARYLQPRQRIRPLLLEIIDPLFAIFVIGPVLAHELNINAWHLLAGLVGLSLGVPIGLLRSRVQYVRAIKASTSVVLTRSRAEYALIVVLVILRSSEDFIRQSHRPSITLLFAALLSLPIGESCARTISIVDKYRKAVSDSPTMGLSD